MNSSSVETNADTDRFAELRAVVAEIRRQNHEYGQPADAVSGHTAPDWLEQAVGLFEHNEAFEEAVRSGEAWRNADRPDTDE